MFRVNSSRLVREQINVAFKRMEKMKGKVYKKRGDLKAHFMSFTVLLPVNPVRKAEN